MKETFGWFQSLFSKRQHVTLIRIAKARGTSLIEIGIPELEREDEFARHARGLKKIKSLPAKILAYDGGRPLEINPVEDLQSMRNERVRQSP